jgi:hypothetical protein
VGGDILHVSPVRRCFFSVIEIFSVVKLNKLFGCCGCLLCSVYAFFNMS